MSDIYDLDSFGFYGLDPVVRKGKVFIRQFGHERVLPIDSKEGKALVDYLTMGDRSLLLRPIPIAKHADYTIPYQLGWESVLKQIIIDKKSVYMVELVYDNKTTQFIGRYQASRPWSNVRQIIGFVNQQESHYSDSGLGDMTAIRLTRVPVKNTKLPLAADGLINCVLKAVLDGIPNPGGRKRKSDASIIKKLSPMPVYADIPFIERIEETVICRIFVFDQMGFIWHASSRNKGPIVSLLCKDYHCILILNNKAALANIRAINVDYEVKDGLLEPVSREISSNFEVSLMKPREPTPFVNEWHEPEELDKMLVDFELENRKHESIILQSGTCIGIIDRSVEPQVRHKSRAYIKASFIPYTSDAWSWASYLKALFKNHLWDMYGPSPETCQITEPTILEHVRSGQVPLHHIFEHGYKGQCHGIDQRRAYSRAAVGEIGDDLKAKYFKGFPTVPRGIKNYDQVLDQALYDEIKDIPGFAVYEYDRSGIRVQTFFDGYLEKGTCCEPIPCILYEFDAGVKITLKRLYISERYFHPFQTFVDVEVKKLWNEVHCEEDQNLVEKCLNPLIGGINKNLCRTKVVTTVSRSTNSRIHYMMEKKGFKLIHVSRAEYDQSKYTDERVVRDLMPYRYTYRYSDRKELLSKSFQACHLSAFVLGYQKMALHSMMVSLVDTGRTLLYCNTDSIVFGGKPVDLPMGWLYEYKDCDEVLIPQLRKPFFIEGGVVKNRKIADVLSIEEIRKIPNREYIRECRFRDIVLPDYDIRDEKKLVPGQSCVFIHARPGYGKSEILKFLSGKASKTTQDDIAHLGLPSKKHLLVSTTHNSRKLIGADLTFQKLVSLMKHGSAVDVEKGLKAADYAISVDEASMLDASDINNLDYWLRRHTGVNRPFGSCSVVLSGDLAQLPPPTDEPLITESKLFHYFRMVELTKNYRAGEDSVLRSILDKIRDYYGVGRSIRSMEDANDVLCNVLSESELKALNDRYSKKPSDGFLILHRDNHSVAVSNRKILGRPPAAGDQVILRVNLNKWGMYNGDVFTIESIDEEHLRINGRDLPVSMLKKQPGQKHADLVGVHASTIHYSQGLTAKVYIHTEAITMNLLYVGLSRARKMDDIEISMKFDDDKEEAKLPEATVMELFDRKAAIRLLENKERYAAEFKKEDGPDPFQQLERYMAAGTDSDISERRVTYHKVSEAKTTGRFFADKGLSLQGLKRKIRNTIAGDLYHDYDMVNAHPVILRHIIGDLADKTPNFVKYIENREPLLADLIAKNKCSRDHAKMIILSLMNGGRKDYDDLLHKPRWLQDIRAEFELIHNALAERDPDRFSKHVERRKRAGKDRNHGGSYMNMLICEKEDLLLQTMIKVIGTRYPLDTYVMCFDGLMIRPLIDDLTWIEKELEKQTGVPIKLARKDMDDRL